MEKQDKAPIIIGKLLNINGILKRKSESLYRPYGMNQAQFSILFSISQKGKTTQKEVINQLVLEKPHVSKVIKKLQKLGYIEIQERIKESRIYP